VNLNLCRQYSKQVFVTLTFLLITGEKKHTLRDGERSGRLVLFPLAKKKRRRKQTEQSRA